MLPLTGVSNSPFVQFRAGKCKYTNGTVYPEPARGYLSFVKVGERAVEVVWSGMTSGEKETVTWEKDHVGVRFVDQCKTGRVLLFQVYKEGKETLHFFWMQAKSDEEDAEHLKALQQVFTKPQSTASAIQLSDLQKIIASISGHSQGGEVSLTKLFSSDKITEALKSDPDFFKSRLEKTLPTELASENVLTQIKSPQFSQAVTELEAILKNPQACAEVCRMFGLPSNCVGVREVVNAIIKEEKDKAK